MDDMQVYIANLGKYNEGELVGAWFTFPIDFEEVKEKIGLNDEYEEYAIHDYELIHFHWRTQSTMGNGIGITRRITIGAICSAHSFFKH